VAARAPRVHAITGAVSAPFVADVLLAMGARPVLTHHVPELADMLAGADALLVNLGQPDEGRIRAVRSAALLARRRGLPWVLDPAHAHDSPARLARAEQLAGLGPAVFKPNAAELAALAARLGLSGVAEAGAGADAAAAEAPSPEGGGAEPSHAAGAAALARRLKTVVLATGPVDVVTDGERVFAISGGHAHMNRGVAFGCALGGAVAAFLAIAPPAEAAAAGAVAFARAAEAAAAVADGPASFRIAFLDALARLAEGTSEGGKLA
jgi:hydroxyethylthiazole kinase